MTIQPLIMIAIRITALYLGWRYTVHVTWTGSNKFTWALFLVSCGQLVWGLYGLTSCVLLAKAQIAFSAVIIVAFILRRGHS